MTAFRVPSETVRGQSYKVEVQNGEAVCDCPGFRSHHHCKHADALKERTMSMSETIPEERALAVTDEIPEALPMQMPATTLPTQAELSIIGKIAATVIGAKGHAVPSAIDSPAKAAAVMLAGWEMGLLPMAALRHVYVVNGRTEPDAQAMMGIVRAQDSTARFIFLEYTEERCTVQLRRRGEDVVICTYTLEDAQKSGQLAKDGPWHKYPRDMLAWAAVKRVCRLGAADLVNAIGSRRVADVREMLPEPHESDAPLLPEPSEDAADGAVAGADEAREGEGDGQPDDAVSGAGEPVAEAVAGRSAGALQQPRVGLRLRDVPSDPADDSASVAATGETGEAALAPAEPARWTAADQAEEDRQTEMLPPAPKSRAHP